jgi:hypothetical protein
MTGRKKTKDLDELLEYIEERIDLEHLKKVEKIHVAANRFEKVPYLPITFLVTSDFFNYSESNNLFPYQEAFDDPVKMMYNELMQTCWGTSVYNSIQLKDFFPLQIRSNHGIGIIASMFGAKPKIMADSLPFVRPIENKKEIRNIIKKGIPNFKAGLGKKVLENYQFFNDKLKKYPKCSEGIKITHPDMQGPFDIAHQIMGSDIFYMVIDDPDLIHELLDLITETYIRYRKYIEKYYHLNDKAAEDMIYIHGDINYGRVVIKDDTAQVSLSPEMYRDFAGQYNEKIFKEFKGTYHCCGKINDHIYQLLDEDDNVHGFNYGNPELHDIKYVYRKNYKKKRAIYTWGWNQDFSYLKEILNDKDINTGLTLACMIKNIEEGKQILEKYYKE